MGGFYAENYAVFATGNTPFIAWMGGEMNASEKDREREVVLYINFVLCCRKPLNPVSPPKTGRLHNILRKD